MKKIAAIFLAAIIATCSMFSTVASAVDLTDKTTNFDFGFIIKNDSITVDVENNVIYGFEGVEGEGLTKDVFLQNIDANKSLGYELKVDNYVGTGSKVVLSRNGDSTEFSVVLLGDLNGDGVFNVLDASISEKLSVGHTVNFGEDAEVFAKAADLNGDGNVNTSDFSSMVNGVLKSSVEQPKDGTNTDIKFEDIDTQPFTGLEVKPDDEIVIKFDNYELNLNEDFTVKSYSENIELGIATLVIEGKGAFAGEKVLTFEIVGLIQDITNELQKLVKDAGLDNLVSVSYDKDVKNLAVTVDASVLLNGTINGNMEALNGLLTKIDAYRAKNLQGIDLTVGNYNVAVDGAVNRGELKSLIFDFANGFFADFANSTDNIAKVYAATLVEPVVKNNVVVDAQTDFGIKLEVVGNQADIDTFKEISGKLSRYLAFNVVDGNAVIDVTLPAGFAKKVVDTLSNDTGDVAYAKTEFDNLSFGLALNLAAMVKPEDISTSNADEITRALSLVTKLDGIVNKVLDEVTLATVTNNKGDVLNLLSGEDFYLGAEDNSITSIVSAIALVLDPNIFDEYISYYSNGDIYTAEFNIGIGYKGITEKIIINVDVFGAIETPDIIEKTAEHFSGIINTLGLSNVASVSYDAENGRALATLNARELATNLTIDETAFDGLYTDIQGYFDDNYGTATIKVGKYEIVTAGKINKTELKNLIFSAATGFFEDASNIGDDKVLRSFNTVVTEADGKVHKFDLDFALDGDDADIERIEKIAKKVANYVSFDVVDGNAVVNIGLPAGLRNTIIEKLGNGDQAKAIEEFNSLTLDVALVGFSSIDVETISAANAKEIQAIIDLVANVDTIINKVLSKISAASVTTVNGATHNLLKDDAVFEVYENTFGMLVGAVYSVMDEDLLANTKVSEFVNANGTYTAKFDAALSIGGIKETVIVNLDIFGDIEKENAIEDTVDYVDSILSTLGCSSFASVEISGDKAVATFNATKLLENGLDSLNSDALNGLYTNVKDFFYANFSDSTIRVGGIELVTDGIINKPAVKDLIFDFAKGFFTDVANMDANTFRSYTTEVTDADGNTEVFDFDFNLDGNPAHIEKLQTISAKVAEHISFTEVDGNAVVNVKVPAGLQQEVINRLGNGDKAAAIDEFNSLTVGTALYMVTQIKSEQISKEYADEIDKLAEFVFDAQPVVNKVLDNISSATVNVNSKALPLLVEDTNFEMYDESINSILASIYMNVNTEVHDLSVADFMNKDGTYTLNCTVTAKGITETLTITVDVF